jgi:hypothetical protein
MVFAEATRRGEIPCELFGVDLWQGDEHTGLYDGDEIYQSLRQRVAGYGNVHLIKADFKDARKNFPDGSIDLLHIDGLHTYEAVKGNFETYLSAMSRSGVVLFHDTQVRKDTFGVWRLWAELRDRYPSFEFEHGYGLGVLLVGKDIPERFVGLCVYLNADRRNAALYRELMAYASEEKARTAVERERMTGEVEAANRERDAYLSSLSFRVGFYVVHPWKLAGALLRRISH